MMEVEPGVRCVHGRKDLQTLLYLGVVGEIQLSRMCQLEQVAESRWEIDGGGGACPRLWRRVVEGALTFGYFAGPASRRRSHRAHAVCRPL